MRALLIQQGLELALEGEKKLPSTITKKEKGNILNKAHSALIICLSDKVLKEISKETTAAAIWTKLETLHMTKSPTKRLYLKQKLYSFKMPSGKSPKDRLDDFNKIILDLKNIEIKFEDKDQALLLLKYLPNELENLSDTLLYGRDSLTLEEALFSKKLKKVEKM